MILSALAKRAVFLRAAAALVTLPAFALSTLLLIGLAGVQTGCVAQPRGAFAPIIAFGDSKDLDAGNAVCVGENRVGETCYVYSEGTPGGAVGQRVKILCGIWKHSSVRILEIKDSTASHSLEEWAERSWWRRDVLESRAVCEPRAERGTILNGMEALRLNCKLKNGGWPYVALLARTDKTTYLTDGIPAAQGVAEKAIGVISGQLGREENVCRGNPTSWILEAMQSDRPYGADDLAEYYRLMALGQYYNGVKDFAAAENQYREALTFHRNILGEGNSESLDPLAHVALELSNQERFEEADVLFNQVETMISGSEQADYARYLSYKALHLANQRKFDEARKLAVEATRLRKNLLSKWHSQGKDSKLQSIDAGMAALPPDAADIIQSQYIEAAMLRRMGKASEAEQTYSDAKSNLSSTERVPPLWIPQLLGLGARIAGSEKLKEERLREAIDLWKVHAPGERPGALDYLEAGKTYRAQGRLDEALKAFNTGIDLIRRRGSLRFEQLLPYFKTVLEVAEANPGARDGLFEKMFEAGQLVRGSRTRQDIARAAVRLGAENPDAQKLIRDLQEAENDDYMQRRNLAAEKIWRAGKLEKQYEEQLEQVLQVGQRIKDKELQVHDAFPQYNQLIDAVVSADDVLKALKPGEALVQVLLGDTESLLFLARDGVIRAYRLQVTEQEANTEVESLRKGLELSPKLVPNPFNVTTSYSIYQKLFYPVLNEIRDVKHLITVPTGALLSLPFGLLVTEDPSSIAQQDAPEREGGTIQRGLEVIGKDGKSRGLSNYASVAWLAKRSAISLSPSVRSFIDLRRVDRSRASKAFVGFGDPIPFTDAAIKNLKLPENCLKSPKIAGNYQLSIKDLEKLRNSKKELSSISGMFPRNLTDLVLSEQFTEQKVKTYPLQDYRILYFATHGLLPGELQCQPEPSLVASPSDSTRKGDEGMIDASEILHFKLDADLVVLSACNTGGAGAEKEIRGENLAGLARAFFFAGARSVLATHWYIPDKESTDLTIDMFQRLYDTKEPKSLAIALNLAQRDLMTKAASSHPFFWGAFSLVGDGARIVSQQ